MASSFKDDVEEFLYSTYRKELDRLELDCAEAIFLTPYNLDSLTIVKLERIGDSLADRVGWLCCLLDKEEE